MFVVRKIYLEKAESYLRYHGKANFSQGALAHDQLRAMKIYGLMPEEIYNGKVNGKTHNHTELEKELKNYLDSVLAKEIIEPHWKERFERVYQQTPWRLSCIIYLRKCHVFSPKAAATFGINPDDYVGFTSYTHHPFYTEFDFRNTR